MLSLQPDYDSYLVIKEESSPERMLILSVLEYALRDLGSSCNQFKREAQQWFREKASLFPIGVGYQDVLDLKCLTKEDIQYINSCVQASEENKLDFCYALQKGW